jgi:hypothetical protein
MQFHIIHQKHQIDGVAMLKKYSLYDCQRLGLVFGGDRALFNFAFAENYMLARPRIIFFQFKLLRLGAWVLFGHVEIACVGCAYEFNLKGRGLRHEATSLKPFDKCRPGAKVILQISCTKCGKTRRKSSVH